MTTPTYFDNIYRDEYGRNFVIGKPVDVSTDPGLAKVVQEGEQAILVSPKVQVETSVERAIRKHKEKENIGNGIAFGVIGGMVAGAVTLTILYMGGFFN